MKIKINISWHANPECNLLSWICISKTHALEFWNRKETVVGCPQTRAKHPHSLWFIPLPQGENRRKARCLVNWNNDSLIEKAKTEGTKEAKRRIHSLLPTARQMSNHFLGSNISACIIIVREHKCYHWKHPLFLLIFFSLYCGAEHHTVWNIHVVNWDHLFWVCPLPTSCPPSAPSLQGKEKALRLCKHCSVTTKTLVCYQWQSAAPYGLLGTKLTPSQPDSVCL